VVDDRGESTLISPTDREANGRMAREVPRYRYDWTSTGEGGDRA
jgi:hypothetical protein